MAVHLPPSGKRVVIGISIELSKVLFSIAQAQSEQQGVPPVIVGAEIPFAEDFGQRHLKELFAIIGNTKFGLAG